MNLKLLSQDEAITLLEEALDRVKNKKKNHIGNAWQCGGAYWRLCNVLEFYLYPQLVSIEGIEHAKELINTHGAIYHDSVESESMYFSVLKGFISNQTEEFSLHYAATEWLKIDAAKLTLGIQARIGVALRQLGCKRVERRPYSKSRFLYIPPSLNVIN